MALPTGSRLTVMAPVVRGRPGGHKDILAQVRKNGLVKVRVDGQMYDIEAVPELAVRKKHTIDAVVDRIILREGSQARLAESIRLALTLADGLVTISSADKSSTDKSSDAGAKEHGATKSELSTDSRTGALSLYEKVGMVTTSVWVNRAIDL